MNATVIISVSASVASILSLGYAVVIRKVDDAVLLLKAMLPEQAEVEILSLIEQTVSNQVEEKTWVQAKHDANGQLTEESIIKIARNVCTCVEEEHMLMIKHTVWSSIEHSIQPQIDNCVATQRAKQGLTLIMPRVQAQVVQAVLMRIKTHEQSIIDHRVRASMSEGVSQEIGEKVRVLVEQFREEHPLPPFVRPDDRESTTDVVEYSYNDVGYRDWVEGHPHGFIINTYQPSTNQRDYMVLHKARCGSVTNFGKRKPGAFTCNVFMKVCADEVVSLREWAKEHDRLDGQFTGECGLCKPLGGAQQQNNSLTDAHLATPTTAMAPSKTFLASATQDDHAILLAKSQALPPAQGNYLLNDYVENLLLTVVDFQLTTKVVQKAQAHYLEFEKNNIRTHQDLKQLLAAYPNTQEGNTQMAQKLWGYNLWTRAEMLRRLVSYFESVGVTNQEQLASWAADTQFEDFAGKVKGVGYAIFQFLVMRQGVETIKPDVHVLRFVNEALGHPVTPEIAVSSLEQVAKDMGIKAYELDWRIWENGVNKAAVTGGAAP